MKTPLFLPNLFTIDKLERYIIIRAILNISFIQMIPNKRFLVILLSLACLVAISSDIYTPSVNFMATDLRTSVNKIQSSMAIFMVGVTVSQLIYGPFSEAYGRRLPLIIGLLIMLVGSVVCFYTKDISILLIGRLTQGLGAGAASCLWRPFLKILSKTQCKWQNMPLILGLP